MSAQIIQFPTRRRATAIHQPTSVADLGRRRRPLLYGPSNVKFRELSSIYTTDPLSDFHKLRWVTKQAYRNYIRRLDTDLGDRELGGETCLTIRDIKGAHAVWSADGKIPMGHGLVTMLRIVIGFGAGILENPDCQRIAGGLRSVKFPNGKKRSSFLTEAQVVAVCDRALIDGARSIALAHTLQWWCSFRQKDIIGEWVPGNQDSRPSNVFIGGLKWVGGITAEEINDNRVLTHRTSKKNKVISIPLANCPLSAIEWDALPKSGPLIIDPETGLPFRVWTFQRLWRKYADQAGVPRSIVNMDTRAGRITRLLADGVNPDDVRKLATHSQLSTTMGYSRGDDEAVARIVDGEQGLAA